VVRLFLGFLMLFAIGGAIAGVVTYMRMQHDAAPAAVAAKGAVVPVVMNPIYVPIRREDDANEMRTYVFVLDVRPGTEERVFSAQATLRNAFTRVLTTLADRADSEGIPKDRLAHLENIENIDYVKAQLREIANEALDPGARKAGREPADVVQEVLIRSMIANVT
jgi:hypothetical protein